MNSWLAEHCKRNGLLFIDNWAYFYGKDHLYAREGVPLSACGTGALAWSLHREMRAWGFFRGRKGVKGRCRISDKKAGSALGQDEKERTGITSRLA